MAFEPLTAQWHFDVGCRVLTYRVGRPTLTRLEWFDRSGTPLGTVGSSEQIGLTSLRLSPNGRRIAVERSVQNETDVWLLDVARQTRFTHGSNGTLSRLPLWSPDGKGITFETVHANSVTLSAKPSSDDGPEDVLYASQTSRSHATGRRTAFSRTTFRPEVGYRISGVAQRYAGADIVPGHRRNELWGQFAPNGAGWHINE